MWKLVLLLVTLAVTVQGQDATAEDVAALWERIHELEDRTIHVHVHGGEVRGGGHEGHGHGEHAEHADHGEHAGNDEHIHVHVHAGPQPPRNKDLYHGNPIPGAEAIDVDYVHGVCHLKPGSIGLSGNIYLRQDFMGEGPVEMKFEVSGFSGHAHGHNFTVHREGSTADQCSHVGDVFTPPHRRPVPSRPFPRPVPGPRPLPGPGGRPGGRPSRRGGGGRRGPRRRGGRGRPEPGAQAERREGYLGVLECDDNGVMSLDAEFDTVSIIGLHSIIGRSIVVKNSGDDVTILGCCGIGWSDGSPFGDVSPAWLKGERDELNL